ncbi:MAG: hypothetical protein HC890_11120 [Chloroflexaceae bacterium]|nr:hypothetical protein [Chloroflexaceae bacterium]
MKPTLKILFLVIFGWCGLHQSAGLALPPPDEIPEEVLRNEIILEGISPISGEPLSPAEYAELQARLAESPFPPQVNPKIQELVLLLNIRKFLQILTPF